MDAKKATKLGALFQMPMLVSYMASLWYFPFHGLWYSPWYMVSNIGAFLFLYCLVMLYFFKRRTKRLMTSGPFRYTRHPMYTGLALIAVSFWLPEPVSHAPFFYTLQTIFIIGLIGAGWFQEKETLARFGAEAEAYYARTPRLFFMYPFMHRAARV